MQSSKIFAKLAGGFVCFGGGVVLIGWAFNIETLKTVFHGLVTMKANTAMGLILSGLGLALLPREKAGAPFRFCTAALAMVVIALGGLTLSEYFFGWDLRIDELLFRDVVASVGTSRPGQMAPSTAYSFVLTGSALLVASWQILPRLRFAILTALGATVLVIGAAATLGQISNLLLHFRLWNYFGMAIHTAVGFVLLGAGLLAFVKGERGMSWALDKMTTLGFAVAMGIMLTAAGVSCNYANQLQETTSWVGRTHEVLKDIEDLRADKANLESMQHGYLILGDEHLLTPREEIEAEVRKDLENLRKSTAGDPRQQKYLDQLEPLIAQRADFAEHLIAVRRQQGFPAAQEMLATGPELALSADIARALGAMSDEEYSLLAARQKQSDAASIATFLLLPLGVFLSLTILSLALFFLNAGVGERALAEEKLKASLKEVTDLRDALDEHALVAITDPRGRITYVNDKFCAISKYSREELLGRDHRIINSGYHPKEFIRDLWTTITEGRVWHGEIKNKAKDGSFYWVDTTIVPFLNEQGQPRQYVAVRADITERKAAEEARRTTETRYRALFDYAPDGIVIADSESTYLDANPSICRMLGYTHDELVGLHASNIVAPTEIPQIELALRDIKTKSGHHREWQFRRKDGSIFAAEVRATRMPDGNLMGMIRDITERKTAEEKIQRLNSALEDRVAERTAELEAANKELEAFSYSVSHDLRAPLRAVDGFSQAVLEDYGPHLPEEGRRYLQTVREGAQRMGVLIDDLLAFSRLSRTPLNEQEVDTGKQVRGILEGLNTQRQGRKVEIRIGNLPTCRGASAMLDQVWTNLLSNALKYTRQRETALIEIGCNLEQNENVYFVRDNGAGFDMKYAHKLFGVFQRLHRADEFEGTGVGLAIVQRIVHRHGGRIWVDAAPDRGATFYFTLKEKTDL